MADFDGNITPAGSWATVPSLSTDADLLGGTGGPMNAQAVALAARTNYLKTASDAQQIIVDALTGQMLVNTGKIELLETAVDALEAPTGVTAGTYGDATHFPTFQVGADGKIISAGTFIVPSAPDLSGYAQKSGFTMTGAINEKHGADIASAGTINLDTATGNVIDITGTTAITGVTLADGAERVCRAAGVFTLTNGASLVLLGGANITTAVGDYFVLRGYASGVIRMTDYARANGAALAQVAAGSMILLGQTTQTNQAQIDVEGFFDATYDRYIIQYLVKPVSDSQDLYIQFKIAGSYVTGGYESHLTAGGGGATAYSGWNSPGTAIKIVNNTTNATAAEGAFIDIQLSLPTNVATRKQVFWSGVSSEGGGSTSMREAFGAGHCSTVGALTGLRIKAAVGNISATVRVYGIKKS